MSMRDHDVSGTGRQTVGRMMLSITTMVPTWQCGHSRNDCPVSECDGSTPTVLQSNHPIALNRDPRAILGRALG